jgi:hypothetical protein
MDMQWQPPPPPQLPPQAPFDRPRPPRRKSWLPVAILGAAIVLAAGLIGGALILKSRDDGTSTCAAWKETRLTLRAIPALPDGWTFTTPNIDTAIKNQNAPVGVALDLFEPKIKAEPADVAQAARDYVAARRQQMQSLSDRSYVPADGAAVDTALARLNQLCGIPGRGLSI